MQVETTSPESVIRVKELLESAEQLELLAREVVASISQLSDMLFGVGGESIQLQECDESDGMFKVLEMRFFNIRALLEEMVKLLRLKDQAPKS